MIELAHSHGGVIPAYAAAMLIAFAVGFAVFRYNTRGLKARSDELFAVLLAAFLGGIIGAKLPMVVLNLRYGFSWQAVLSGRTIVGGLLGGTLAVLIVKRKLGIKGRYGNLLAPSIALGMAVGRIGCFLSGCCFGTPTTLPWGMRFGDDIVRHPTQLYEGSFCLIAFFLLQRTRATAPPGSLLVRFFIAYFVFRFFEEFIRPHETLMSLTSFQWISVFGILVLTIKSMWLNCQEATP